MTATLLVDPSIIDYDNRGSLDQVAFWLRVLEWQGDKRTRLGPWTFEMYYRLYERALDPAEGLVPLAVKKSVHRTLGNWLAHGPVEEAEIPAGMALDHAYGGAGRCAEDLVADLFSTRLLPDVAVATDRAFWAAPEPSTVGLTVPPPDSVPLHFDPNTPSDAERIDEQRRRCDGGQLIVVGGQQDSATVRRLTVELGIPSNHVRWIPSEPDKKPNNLSAVVRGASQTGALVLCITGKVAHETMYELRDKCTSHGVPYLRSESTGGVVNSVLNYFA